MKVKGHFNCLSCNIIITSYYSLMFGIQPSWNGQPPSIVKIYNTTNINFDKISFFFLSDYIYKVVIFYILSDYCLII